MPSGKMRVHMESAMLAVGCQVASGPVALSLMIHVFKHQPLILMLSQRRCFLLISIFYRYHHPSWFGIALLVRR